MSLPFVIAFIILLAILFNVSVEWKVVVTIIMLILGIFVLVLFIGLNKRDIRLR
jgi:archaellum biogenesis protein FlaJ (TadC family)